MVLDPVHAGEEHSSQEASALDGDGASGIHTPLGILTAASSCSAARGAAPSGIPQDHPPAPASTAGKARSC